MLADVQALAGEIGPRGTGTAGEAAAAELVAARLTALGLPVERHTFRAVASQNAFPVAADLLVLLAAALYPWGWALGRWAAAGLALAAAPLLWRAIRFSSSPLRRLLPQVTSRSVLGRVPPLAEPRRQAVLLAHLDTNRCRFAWQSSAVHLVEPMTWVTLSMLAAPGLLYLAGALLGGPIWVWWVSLLPVAYSLGTIVTLWRDEQTPFSPGAHDNAASVAVALEVAAQLAAQPLERLQVWLAFTGAEETDHAGLYALLKQHGSALQSATFIGLEGLGSGDLVYLTRQGVGDHYTPDPDLAALVAEVAAQRPELGVRAAMMGVEDEVGTLRRLGYRAICLAGRDPASGTLPHWHRADDTAETVSAEFLARAAKLLLALLAALDGKSPRLAMEEPCAHL